MSFPRNIASDRAILGRQLQLLGLPISLASPLLAHAEAVAGASARLGLVAPGDRDAVVSRHVADSLLFARARAPKRGERWADAGSGAGFPGLILACSYPEAEFTLVEPHAKRAGFLELQVAALGAGNVRVLPQRLEEVDPVFTVAVARAFQAPRETLSALLGAVEVGGQAIVAAASSADAPPGATVVRLGELGGVDSPGVLFMMSRVG